MQEEQNFFGLILISFEFILNFGYWNLSPPLFVFPIDGGIGSSLSIKLQKFPALLLIHNDFDLSWPFFCPMCMCPFLFIMPCPILFLWKLTVVFSSYWLQEKVEIHGKRIMNAQKATTRRVSIRERKKALQQDVGF